MQPNKIDFVGIFRAVSAAAERSADQSVKMSLGNVSEACWSATVLPKVANIVSLTSSEMPFAARRACPTT